MNQNPHHYNKETMTMKLKDVFTATILYVGLIALVLYIGKLYMTSSYGSMKIILFWTPFWDRPDFYVGYGWRPFHQFHCPFSKCMTTSDPSLLHDSDAVIVHINNITHPSQLPPTRVLDQWWIYVNMEPPTETRADLSQFEGFFNLSLSYRKESTFYNPYGKLIPRKGSHHWRFPFWGPTNYAKGKSGLVTWLISHCGAPSGRDWYALELAKYIQVDIYGKCGKECPRDCDNYLSRNYKFYLAFENNICQDYITEKPWYALQQGMIPIVMGGGDYEHTLPEHSYIDIKNFSSPSLLADYLKKLDNNDTLYSEYFKWKDQFDVRVPNYIYNVFCDICEFLHGNHKDEKVIDNLQEWYGEVSGNPVCKNPGIFYEHIDGFTDGFQKEFLTRQPDK